MPQASPNPEATTDTKVTKTCPHCSDAAQELFTPNIEAVLGRNWYYVAHFPLHTTIHSGGLPTVVKHRCTACKAVSTWDLVQTDLEASAIDYTLRT